MVCPECGVRLDEPIGLACPRCDTPFPRPVGNLGWKVTMLFALMALALTALVLMRIRHFSSGLVTLVSVVSALIAVALAVVFLIWFDRVRRNAGIWGPQRYTQGWAIGGWFVPVAFAWIPVRIAGDVWRATTESESLPWTLYAWWLCWVGSWLAGFHTSGVGTSGSGQIVAAVGVGFYLFNVPDLIFAAVAAVFGAVVVHQFSRAQDARTARGPVPAVWLD